MTHPKHAQFPFSGILSPLNRYEISDGSKISFVIPALNEERNIGNTLRAIRRFMDGHYRYEMIVIDHGSRDRTAEIAHAAGATVHRQQGGTIGSLRNYGARQADGKILIFLDADVELTKEWGQRFPETLRVLCENALLVTGSHCNAPPNGTWIERHWFRHFASERNVSHIGTGHMVVSRSTFLAVGGFDEHLETGEDYDFCRRVAQSGGTIINDPDLEVIHHEFPKNLVQFVQREAWHGRGDLRSWKDFRRSKVALGAALFGLLHMVAVLGAVFARESLYHSLVAMAGLLGLLFASSLFKYWHSPWNVILINSVIFYFYYLGRSLAFVTALRGRLGHVRASRRIPPTRNQHE